MNKPFDMYSWRRKYIHLAENDTEVNEALMGAQDAIEKFYGEKIQPGSIKYDFSLSKYIAKNPEGEAIYFDFNPAGTGFHVYRLEDWYDFLQAAKGLPVADAEYRNLKSDFQKKALDFVLFGMSKPKPEMEESLNEEASDVDESYYKVLALIRQEARKLNDDDAYKFHELLKGFFNRLLENSDITENEAGYALGNALFKLQNDIPSIVKDWKKSIADEIQANGTSKYINWTDSDFLVDYAEFKDKWMEREAKTQIDHDQETLRRERGLEEGKGIYFIKVSLRDARKAHDVVEDMYRNAGVMMRGNEFFSADLEVMEDLIGDFGARDIEIEDDNIDFSDYDGHSDNDTDILDLYEKYLKEK